jgi:GNAT superfamily N-acetyltransferase
LFDCVDDERAADLLLEAAERFAVRQGARELVGNFNLTGNHAIGVVTDGFDRAPYIEQTYNPAHVVRLLERRGYERFFPMRTWELDVDHHAADGLWGDKQRRLLADSGLRVEPVRRRTLRRQMDECRELLNRAFDRNPLFVPMTKQEFDFYAKDLMWIVDPRITVVAYDGARAVGAIVCVPDLNPLFRRIRSRVSVGAILPFLRYRRACRRATMIYYAVDPEHQNRGVNGVMLHALVGQLARAGYTHVGGTWIADENVASLRQAEKLGARVHQRLHLFRRALAS